MHWYLLQARDSLTGLAVYWASAFADSRDFPSVSGSTAQELSVLATHAPEVVPGTVRDGAADDSAALIAAMATAGAHLELPGADTYLASNLPFNTGGIDGKGSTLKATANDVAFFSGAFDFTGHRQSTIKSFHLDGNGKSGVFGLKSLGELRTNLQDVTMTGVAFPLWQIGDIYGQLQSVHAAGGIEIGWLLENNPTIGGIIAISAQQVHLEQGNYGMVIKNVATDVNLGYGHNTLDVTFQYFSGPGLIMDGGTAGASVRFEKLYLEGNCVAALGTYPRTVRGITLSAKYEAYITGKSVLSIGELTMIPAYIAPGEGAGMRVTGGSQVFIDKVNAAAIGAVGVPPIIVDAGSYCQIKGPLNAYGQNWQGVDLTEAVPIETHAGGGFSAWRLAPRVIVNRTLKNQFWLNGGDPNLPGIDVSGTSSPATVGTFVDPYFGTTRKISFQNVAGNVTTNRGATALMAAVAGTTGESYGVSFLARLVSGTSSTVWFYYPFENNNATAQVVLTPEWQRIILIGKFAGGYSSDTALYYWPLGADGPEVGIQCMTSLRVMQPQELAPLFRGECSP